MLLSEMAAFFLDIPFDIILVYMPHFERQLIVPGKMVQKDTSMTAGLSKEIACLNINFFFNDFFPNLIEM